MQCLLIGFVALFNPIAAPFKFGGNFVFGETVHPIPQGYPCQYSRMHGRWATGNFEY